MNYKVMNYKSMRFRKYYDAIRTNQSFSKTSLKQKAKIITNVMKFLRIQSKKPLIIKNKPVTAQIEPTSLCNLGCRFCVRTKMGVPFGSMSFEIFKKILDKLDCLFKINLSGHGELFLNKEIFDMIRYANNRGILINISTNGTLLTKDVIDKICQVDIGEIGISVDSTKKEKYEKVRINANFGELMKNIKNLTEEIKKRKRKTIVSIAPIIFKNNIEELPEFVELGHKLGVNKISFQTLQTKENFFNSYDKEMKSQIVTSDSESVKLKEKMIEAKKLGDIYEITIIFDEDESPGCIWPWRGIYITYNGDVTACCKITESKEFELGNIIKQNFWEVWNGEKYQELRKLLKERKAPPACVGCNRV